MKIFLQVIFSFYCFPALAQDSSLVSHKKISTSPYHTSFRTEAIIIGSSVGANILGLHLINNKNDLTPAELRTKTPDKLPFFDRGNAGYYSVKADRDSYILFNGSYVYPVVAMLIDKSQRKQFGQVFTLYVETIGITGSMYTLTAGLVYRSRPFVYGDKAPLEKRLDKGAQRSFYGGHVATTAAFSFFTAKVFQDFHPNSKAIPYIYAGAAVLPAIMAYERYKAGYHFLSDCVLSYAIGAATGYLVPHLHKKKIFQNVSVTPIGSTDYKGLSLVYKF
jgi:membrane-associated phospholipid phosphatase